MTFWLRKLEGPECPECGCNDTVIADQSDRRAARQWVQFECRYCGNEFYHGHSPDSCIKCKSTKTEGRSTQGTIAYRECLECGHKYCRSTKVTRDARAM